MKISDYTERKLQIFKRIKLQGSVILHDEDALYIAPLNDISAGGIFINKLLSLPYGRSVRIVVKSKALRFPVQARGRIVRVQDKERPGIAVEFTSISSREQEAIKNCVEEMQLEGSLKFENE